MTTEDDQPEPRWTVACRLTFAWGPLNIEDGKDAEAFVRWAVHRELLAHGLAVASVSAVTRHTDLGTPEEDEVEIVAHMGRVISALRAGGKPDLRAATEALRAWLDDHDIWPDR